MFLVDLGQRAPWYPCFILLFRLKAVKISDILSAFRQVRPSGSTKQNEHHATKAFQNEISYTSCFLAVPTPAVATNLNY